MFRSIYARTTTHSSANHASWREAEAAGRAAVRAGHALRVDVYRVAPGGRHTLAATIRTDHTGRVWADLTALGARALATEEAS